MRPYIITITMYKPTQHMYPIKTRVYRNSPNDHRCNGMLYVKFPSRQCHSTEIPGSAVRH